MFERLASRYPAIDLDMMRLLDFGRRSALERLRTPWVTPVSQPMILISQAERSGGTLLLRLFDDHRECFVHPLELQWGRPKSRWPELRLGGSARRLFAQLEENWVHRHVGAGGLSQDPGQVHGERHPFVFDLSLQQHLFREGFRARRPRTQREALDLYLTSFFNAWLDYQNIYSGPKRRVVAFAPRVIHRPGNLDAFFRDYPDGVLVSIVREPVSWVASARRVRSSRWPKSVEAVEWWIKSAEATLSVTQAFPGRAVGVLFEDLVSRTEAVMRRLSAVAGLEYQPSMRQPTFNARPVLSDSSFRARAGIDASAVDRSDSVTAEDRDHILRASGDLYQQARERFALPEAAPS